MSLLNLTISTSYDNGLDGITLYEPIDTVILDKLINSSLLKKVSANNKFTKFYNNEKTLLLKYKENLEGDRVKVEYKRKNGFSFGRSNPVGSLGLFLIRKEIRQTIAKNTYVDIDIENCHLVILYQILKNNNIECPHLEKYINNRKFFLNVIIEAFDCNYETSKLLFIMLIYGGDFKNWLKNMIEDGYIDPEFSNEEMPEEIKLFNEEITKLIDIIYKNNKELTKVIKEDKIKRNKDLRNIRGSVCSYFLQECEIQILECVFSYCLEKKYITNGEAVLCADGIMLLKNLYNNKLLQELSEVVENTTGLKLNFVEKPFKNDYFDILDSKLEFDLYSQQFTSGLIADYFKIMYSHKFVVNDGVLYKFNGIYWEKDDKNNSSLNNFVDTSLYNDLYKYCINLHSLNLKDKTNADLLTDETEKNAQLTNINFKTKQINNLMQSISQLRTAKQRVYFVKDIICKITNNNIEFDKNPFLFAFTNKIYNLKENKFIKPEYNQYISITTGWEWCNFYNKKNIIELDKLISTCFQGENIEFINDKKEKIILNDGEDIKNFNLQILSTGLFGELLEKILIAKGSGGNGKSLLHSLFLKGLGGYGYKLPSTVITTTIKEGGNPQLASLHKKRFSLVQEPAGRSLACSATLKELTGDKTLNVRMNHSNKCGISLCHTMAIECNKLLALDEVAQADARRIVIIPYDTKVVDKQIYDEFEDKTNLLIANPEYKTDEWQEKNKQGLIMILFKHWEIFQNNGYKLTQTPARCKKLAVDYLAMSDTIYEWFNEYFIKDTTPNPEYKNEPLYFIDISEIYNVFLNSPMWESLSKQDRRKYTTKKFTTEIMDCMFLKPYIRERKKYKIENKQIQKTIIINYKQKYEVYNDEIDMEE